MIFYKLKIKKVSSFLGTVVSALAHAPREARKACANANRALKCTIYVAKNDFVIVS